MKKIILLSLSLLFIPLFAGASLDANLYYGLRNNSDVKQLQEYLIGKGFLTGSATGNFYSLTLNAVKKYQAKQSINQTGYVGILTRTAINNDLAVQLQGSNKQATAETGATPLTPETQKITNDIVSSLQAQIQLLQRQLVQIQQQTNAQQQTIQQIQQNTQQIAQNATPPRIPPLPIETIITMTKEYSGYRFKAEGEDFLATEIIFTKTDKFIALSDLNNSDGQIGNFANTCSQLKEQLNDGAILLHSSNEELQDLISRRYPSECDKYPNAIGYKWDFSPRSSVKYIGNLGKIFVRSEDFLSAKSINNNEDRDIDHIINLLSIKFIGQTTGKVITLP